MLFSVELFWTWMDIVSCPKAESLSASSLLSSCHHEQKRPGQRLLPQPGFPEWRCHEAEQLATWRGETSQIEAVATVRHKQFRVWWGLSRTQPSPDYSPASPRNLNPSWTPGPECTTVPLAMSGPTWLANLSHFSLLPKGTLVFKGKPCACFLHLLTHT